MPDDRTWIVDDLPVGVWVAKVPSGELVYANRTFAEIMGMTARTDVAAGAYATPYGIHGRDGALYPEERMPFVQAIRARRTVVVDDIVIHRHDGAKVYIRAQARPVFDTVGEMTHVVIAFIDISREVHADQARVESEARLAHAHKMESIGRLAGGIAHDFNNLLATAKLLAGTLALDERDPVRRETLAQIDQVTESAVHLTRALLGFARRGKNRAEPLSLNEVVGALAPILTRTIGRHITVHTALDAARDGVRGDRGQLEQVLLNLVVNARDAMVDGGHLSIRTADLAPDAAAARGLPAVPHVLLEVSDTGPGIAPELRDRVFEPYFTTKDGLQAGSGLGLATVWGVVEAHEGTVRVVDGTAPGATFQILLPSIPVTPASREPTEPAVTRGRGRVLLVDDDPGVRSSGRLALEALGYTVVCAEDGLEAVQRVREQETPVELVLLDIVMPRLDGEETWRALRELAPAARVLVMTASAENETVQRLLDAGVHGFVAKPFSVATLSEALSAL